LTIKKITAADSIVEFDFGERCPFTVTFPDDYPKSGSFFVHSEDEWLASDWLEHMTTYCSGSDKLKFSQILDEAISKFIELGYNAADGDDYGGEYGGGGDDYTDYGNVDIDDGGGFGMPVVMPGTEAPKEPPPDPVEQLFKKKKFKQIGSASATLRLISDLKNLYRENTRKAHSFEAIPKVDSATGLENLYEWEVRLYDFEGSLAKDLKEYTKKTGKDYITVSMKFSADYPSKPPFIRIVEPRFQFRTAHVTLGGAVCMEVLTLTEWKPILDVMSVILMLRAEIGAPEASARLDLGHDSRGMGTTNNKHGRHSTELRVIMDGM